MGSQQSLWSHRASICSSWASKTHGLGVLHILGVLWGPRQPWARLVAVGIPAGVQQAARQPPCARA